MSDKPLVIAIGQSWNDLDLERNVLAPDAEVIDGRKLKANDPRWAETKGILLGTACTLDASALAALPACRGIVRYGIGYDNVDVKTAMAKGIIVGIVRDYCLEEVAEHAIVSAVALARGLPHWDRSVREGKWRGGVNLTVRKLSSLSFAIIGFGLIGRFVAAKAKGLFKEVLVHDPLASPSAEDRATYRFVDSFDETVANADILTVHVPLFDATRALIDAKVLARMKKDAIIVNVSRGGIVDEAALLAALERGDLAGAALDTFVEEPLPADHPLTRSPKILLSPHIAWLSNEAAIKLRVRASEEMALILIGQQPTSRVTFP